MQCLQIIIEITFCLLALDAVGVKSRSMYPSDVTLKTLSCFQAVSMMHRGIVMLNKS